MRTKLRSKVFNTDDTAAASGSVSVVTTNTANTTNVRFPTIPSTWPTDGNQCASTPETLNATDTASVTITAPNAPGTYYALAQFDHSQSGAQASDISGNDEIIRYNFTVAQTNHAPTVSTAAQDANGTEGETLQASGAFSDEDGDTLQLSADNTEGTFTDNGDGTWSWSLPTNDDVPVGTITVTADDRKGGTVTDSFDYSAANAAPVVGALSITDPKSGVACLAGNTVTLENFSFSDAGSADTHSAVVAWGDNTSDTVDPAVSPEDDLQHTYSGNGPYTVTVTVTDDNAGVGSASNGASPLSFSYNLSGLLSPVNANGSSIFKSGSTAPMKVSITDCDSKPVPGLTNVSIKFQKLSGDTPVNGEFESVSTSAADTNSLMRWDGTSQYIYNLSTKSLPDATAAYRAVVSQPGSTPSPLNSQNFGLKK